LLNFYQDNNESTVRVLPSKSVKMTEHIPVLDILEITITFITGQHELLDFVEMHCFWGKCDKLLHAVCKCEVSHSYCAKLGYCCNSWASCRL